MTTRGAAWSATCGYADASSAVAAAGCGDQAAFRELYERYARSVYNLVYRSVRNQQLTEDACQEIWVKAYRQLPRLEDPQAFPAWLYRIAARACVDTARKNKLARMTAELPEEHPAPSGGDPEKSALDKERARLAWQALAALPARQHLALFLREVEQRRYKEIAEMLETSEAGVETLLFRARRSFVMAYDRLEAGAQDWCRQAHRATAAIVDGEGTPIQQKALRAHVDACRSCSSDLSSMRKAAAAYSALAPMPVPALLGERIFESLAATGASAAPAGVAKVLALLSAKAKIAAVGFVATGTLITATISSPIGDDVRPDPAGEQRTVSSELQPEGRAWVENGSTAAGAGLTAKQTDGAIPARGLVEEMLAPDTAELLAGAGSQVIADVNATAGELASAADALLHQAEWTADDVPAVVPLSADTEIVPAALPAAPSAPPLP